jgi:hypothetical protein
MRDRNFLEISRFELNVLTVRWRIKGFPKSSIGGAQIEYFSFMANELPVSLI